MVTVEYGKENNDVILLLHGGGLSWWNYREVAEALQEEFHVVMPILDGHGGSDGDFSSIEESAESLIRWIDEKHQGYVAMIGGVSLGGQIAVEMLSRRGNICRFAVIESALAIPMKLTHKLVKPMMDMSYGLIQKPWFAKLQFRALKMKPQLFEEYYRDTCAITKKNMTAFLRANAAYTAKEALSKTGAKVFVYVGGKEPSIMHRSAELLQEKIPDSNLTVFPGWYHGEFSLNHPEIFADEVRRVLKTMGKG